MLKIKRKKGSSLQNLNVVTQYKLVPVIICSQLFVIILLHRSRTNVSVKRSLKTVLDINADSAFTGVSGKRV